MNNEVVQMKIKELNPFHKNPRRGNVALIAKSLKTNGQFKPLLVNKGTHTGRPNEVLTGNHTLKAAIKLQWNTIACLVVDIEEDHANRIVLADNKASDGGGYDDELLLELLEEVSKEDIGLAGSLYNNDDIEALEKVLGMNQLVDDFMDGAIPVDDEIEVNSGLAFTVTVSEDKQEEFYALVSDVPWVLNVAKKQK